MTITRRTFLARSAGAGALLTLGSVANVLQRVPSVFGQTGSPRQIGQTQVTGRWITRAPLPAKRGATSVVELQGKLHVIGGRDQTSVAAHTVYDPVSNSWSMRAPLPIPRDHIGLVVLDGKIHAIGGRFNTFANNTGVHHIYDPAQNMWRTLAPLPTPRSGVAAAVVGRRIYVFGGEETGRVFSENEAYDTSTNSWSANSPMPTPRLGTGAAAIGNLIFIPGGGLTVGGSRPSTIHEVFTPE